MMNTSQHRAAAEDLCAALDDRSPIRALSSTHPGMGVDDGYAIQQHLIATRLAQGRSIRGYKVGLTSEAMQRQLGVDQPDFGVLLDDMVSADSVVAIDSLISPKVEPEFAVILAAPLRGPGLTTADVARAVGHVVASVEIIDSRIEDWKITISDTIADNASSARVVLGATTLPLSDVDLVNGGATIRVNGGEALRGQGSAVMGDPLAAVAWLANTLGERGVEIPAGSLVLPGSVCAAAAVQAGDEVVADFGMLGLITIRFEGGVKQ